MFFLDKIFGDANKIYLKKIYPLIEEINGFEPDFEKLSSEALNKKTKELKKRHQEGETLDNLLPVAFALTREAAKRTLNQRHFDVQLIGGIVLHQGKIAEMKTGEGKTLSATLPAYLNAIGGKGVHIITVNDYLAKRDAVWMGQIYHALGLSVGCIAHDAAYIYNPSYQAETGAREIKNEKLKIKNGGNERDKERDKERDLVGGFKVVESYLQPVSRKEAYSADIVYGTNNEFCFDYLRDNMAYDASQETQRGFNFAIIDEVDSILIDEARTPLIISAPDVESTKMYEEFSKITPQLKENIDYNIDEKMRAATLTDDGIGKIEKILGIENIYEEKGIRYLHYLEQSLRAETLFKRDKDYVVRDGQVIIVDEFTGRLLPGRRYSGGLHQAIEAKENVLVQEESKTLATVTFQNYFRMYSKLSGMTGTAATSGEEFDKVYGLDVVIVPPNKPMIRIDLPDKIYQTEKGKFKALIEEIREKHKTGQPILIGTVSIQKNEYLGKLLEREGVPHRILNAKNHEKEGEIIAEAGKMSQVTLATNIAGRGVDIILGGSMPFLDDGESLKKWQEGHNKVVALGGLCIIGTERHESRRIDNQLRGRAGRQGDPGVSQFFVSLEDDLLRIFGGDNLKALIRKLGLPEDQPIESGMVSKAIESAQSKIEGFNFDVRKHVLEYDDVMNKHRETIYKKRKEYLQSENLELKILEIIRKEIKKITEVHAASENSGDWNVKEIFENMRAIFPIDENSREKLKGMARQEEIIDYLSEAAATAYKKKKEETGGENMKRLEKIVSLRTLDNLWMEHLENMEYLKDAVRLRAYGQQDPLIEYKNEGHKMFQQLLNSIEMGIVGTIFKVSFAEPKPELRNNIKFYSNSNFNQKGGNPAEIKSVKKDKVGRNDPCPCGKKNPTTGQPIKYKKCCGR